MVKDDRLLVTLFLAQMLTIMHYKLVNAIASVVICVFACMQIFPISFSAWICKGNRKYSEIGNIRVLAINVCLVFIFVFTLQERPSELKKTDNSHNFTLYHKKLILWVWRSSKVIKFTSPTFVIIFMIRRHRNLLFLHLPTLIFFWPWFFIPSVQT